MGALNRIKMELEDFSKKPPDNCSLGLVDEKDILHWRATIMGPLALFWWRVHPGYPHTDRIPIQAAENQLRHKDLPPEHQPERFHLRGHPQGLVVPGSQNFSR